MVSGAAREQCLHSFQHSHLGSELSCLRLVTAHETARSVLERYSFVRRARRQDLDDELVDRVVGCWHLQGERLLGSQEVCSLGVRSYRRG